MRVVYNVCIVSKEYKMIRLNHEVYQQLDDFRTKHESFSQAVNRLLQVNEHMRKMLESLAGKASNKERSD